MELRPILSAMLRNTTGAILVGLQIALTLAIVVNSIFIIMQRVEKIGRPPGIDSDNMFFVQATASARTTISATPCDRDLRRAALAARRGRRIADQRHSDVGRRLGHEPAVRSRRARRSRST